VAGVALIFIDGCAPDSNTFFLPQKTNWPGSAEPDSQFSAMSDRCASSSHQMPDNRDHGKDQKKMDQAARDVECSESQNPKHEQNDTDKQKHVVPPWLNSLRRFVAC
jgi:hypothetical protein